MYVWKQARMSIQSMLRKGGVEKESDENETHEEIREQKTEKKVVKRT